jgi:outer membrane protein TolC
MKLQPLFLFFLFFIAGPAFATDNAPVLTFEKIWERAEQNDPSLSVARHEASAAAIGRDRAARIWYPRVFATGRAFSTDDPATNFMYSLGQRQVTAADFAPTSLNHPGSHFFEQGTLGLDLPIYEGGGRAAQAAMAEKQAEAREKASAAQELREFAKAAEAYAALLSLREQRVQLNLLKSGLNSLIDGYRIGAKSNPVGYSGLLGLKNLRNRVEGMLSENEAKAEVRRSELRSLAGELPAAWEPRAEHARDFLENIFPEMPVIDGQQYADNLPALRAARLEAEAMSAAREGEKARFLPRVGLFLQGDLYNGSRAGATSYGGGAYLQWDLFSAPNLGAVAQAEQSAAASEARAELVRRELANGRDAARAGIKAAKTNLSLLDESARLLEEQTQTARDLFRNGSINALQLVEVLNRRADFLTSRAEAELALGQMKSIFYTASAQERVENGKQ